MKRFKNTVLLNIWQDIKLYSNHSIIKKITILEFYSDDSKCFKVVLNYPDFQYLRVI